MNYFFCPFPKSRTVFGQQLLKIAPKGPEKWGFQAYFSQNQIASSRLRTSSEANKWLIISHVRRLKRVSGYSQSDNFRTVPDHSFFEECFINPYKI